MDVRVVTMCIDTLDEPAVAPWLDILDAAERARAARFVFSRDRVTFIAAHMLTRTVLSETVPGTAPGEWDFIAGERGKPVACLAGRPAPVSFNLSHTHGMVGLATVPSPGHDLGFDVEALDRRVTLAVADRYFCPQEIAWLQALPEGDRAEGFLRLWTLKEAFIKATGQGLAQDLSTFWFTPRGLPRASGAGKGDCLALARPGIHFTPELPERSEDWAFDQRIIGERFVAAAGVRCPGPAPVTTTWIGVEPTALSPPPRRSG